MFICFSMARKVADKAFEIVKARNEQRAVWQIQRVFRGFSARDKKKSAVMNAMMAKENLKLHVAAKKVQKRLKGILVRRRLLALDRQVQKVQAFIRMKWYREIYHKLRKDTTTIQRGVRRFLARRDIVKQRLATYLGQEMSILNNIKQVEYTYLFAPSFDADAYQKNNMNIQTHTPNSLKKITLFSRVIDMHVMTDISDIYTVPWSF